MAVLLVITKEFCEMDNFTWGAVHKWRHAAGGGGSLCVWPAMKDAYKGMMVGGGGNSPKKHDVAYIYRLPLPVIFYGMVHLMITKLQLLW